MKLRSTVATFATVFTLAGTAFSQTPINWGSTGAITVSLTLSYTAEALMLKGPDGKVLKVNEEEGGGPTFDNNYTVETTKTVDGEPIPIKTVNTEEYGSKIVVGKWGNAQILELLVEEALIPEKGTKPPYIAGWSLIAVYGADGEPMHYIARHTDTTSVEIPLTFTGSEISAEAKSEKTVMTDYTPLTGEPPPSTTVHTYSQTYKRPGMADVPFYGGPIMVSGLMTGSMKTVLKTEGPSDARVVTEVYVPGAFKLDKIVGSSDLEDVVEGSISIGAGAVGNIDPFLPDL